MTNPRGFFDPDLFARTYRDPLALFSLAVDLLPILGILAFGWGAVPLVALYWLENLVIGGVTIARFMGAFIADTKRNLMAIFMIPFFYIHYGLFCYVHGVFLKTFAETGGNENGFASMSGLITWALSTGTFMPLFLLAIVAVNVTFYIKDFIGKGEAAEVKLSREMFAPYGRIVTLHVAILLGAALMLKMGEPLVGVLLLLALRVVFGVLFSMFRRRKLDQRQRELAA